MIVLPFPPSALSGHNSGNWYGKKRMVAQHREWARIATLENPPQAVPETGDIPVKVRFVPPTKQGDRVNFPNRMKPYFDGIADALKVNDSRFLPVFEFAEPSKPGCVEVTLDYPTAAPATWPYNHRTVEQVDNDLKAQIKASVMAAYERGQITAEEAEDWIVLNGLGDA